MYGIRPAQAPASLIVRLNILIIIDLILRQLVRAHPLGELFHVTVGVACDVYHFHFIPLSLLLEQ